MPRLSYCWRCHDPAALYSLSSLVDSSIRRLLRWIIVAGGEGLGEFQFELASLPVPLGGLGISMSSDLLAYSYAASRIASHALSNRMFPQLPVGFRDVHDHLDAFIASLHPADRPGGVGLVDHAKELLASLLPQQNKQHYMATLYTKSKHWRLSNHAYLRQAIFRSWSSQHRYLLSALSGPLSGRLVGRRGETRSYSNLTYHWLFAIPNPRLGQCMEAALFRAALRFRLLIPFRANPHMCPAAACGCIADPFGYHALDCSQFASERTERHEGVADALFSLASAARYRRPQRNPSIHTLGMSRAGNPQLLRPADLLFVDDAGGRICIDVTVVSPLSVSRTGTSAGRQLGRAVIDAAIDKIDKHDQPCDINMLAFFPFAADVCGYIDQDAEDLLTSFAHRIGKINGRGSHDAMRWCRRRISVALQIGVARQLVDFFGQTRVEGEDSSVCLA